MPIAKFIIEHDLGYSVRKNLVDLSGDPAGIDDPALLADISVTFNSDSELFDVQISVAKFVVEHDLGYSVRKDLVDLSGAPAGINDPAPFTDSVQAFGARSEFLDIQIPVAKLFIEYDPGRSVRKDLFDRSGDIPGIDHPVSGGKSYALRLRDIAAAFVNNGNAGVEPGRIGHRVPEVVRNGVVRPHPREHACGYHGKTECCYFVFHNASNANPAIVPLST